MTNCPNCGAPIKGRKCEYCGTIFGVDKAEESDVLGINIYGVGPVSNLQRIVEEQQRLQHQNILASMAAQNNYIMSGFIDSQNIISAPISCKNIVSAPISCKDIFSEQITELYPEDRDPIEYIEEKTTCNKIIQKIRRLFKWT